MRPRANTPAKSLSKLATTWGLAGLTVWVAAGNPVEAQEINITGHTFELTFVEHQSGSPELARSPTSVPGIALGQNKAVKPAHQENRVALTFRPGHQVDFERERNYGAIYERAPKPESKAPIHVLRGASGSMGEWLPVRNPNFNNVQIRISAHDNNILAELHGPNFMQFFKISTNGKTCSAEISYVLDPGENGFRLINLKTKQIHEITALAADKIRCALGTANIF